MAGRMKARVPVSGAAAAGLLLLLGCGDEAGLLIEISRDDSVPASLGRLELHIGVDGVPNQPTRFVDPDPEEDVRLEGRDLAADPYRLFIRPRDYPDAQLMVAAVAYQSGEVVGFGALAEPVRFVDGEVAMWRIVLRGELPDGFGSTETDCFFWVDGTGARVTIGPPDDKDCDRWRDGEDCNDLDPRVNPSAGEICGNAVDEDCDEEVDEDVDEDGDLVTTCDGDCDDQNREVSPIADEVCDGIDNDCNELCDDNQDGDGDGYTPCGSQIVEGGSACLIDPVLADCDDGDADVSPGALEVCDGRDNDCDFVCDEVEAGLDRDGDGFTMCGSIVGHCGQLDLYTDCQDEVESVFPGAAELCDGIDDDCDGEPLQRGACFAADPKLGCFFGERDCAEQAGDPGDWSSDCRPLPDLVNRAPDAVCATYAGCDQVDDPDPYTCAIESLDGVLQGLTTCGVTYQVATGEQCAGAAVLLPTDGIELCSWAVVGGVDQGDYTIGLIDLNAPGDPQPSVDVCPAALVVTPKRPGPPSPHVLLLSRTVGAELAFFALSFESRPTDECEPSGLDCAGLPPP
jgi:hypothetical protein